VKSPPPKLGSTGDFPRGKMRPDDRGGLKLAILEKEGKVVLAFGTEVSWIGFDPEQAESIADGLREAAARARARRAS